VTFEPARVRLFSLRRILATSLVLLATVPALLVVWTMTRASNQAVNGLSDKILTEVAALVQAETESLLAHAHTVLNGIVLEHPGPVALDTARRGMRDLAQYQPMAIALSHQLPEIPSLHFGNLRGEYLGVTAVADGTRIAVRLPDGKGRTFYQAELPGSNRVPESVEAGNFEPRSKPWYARAVSARGRVFSPVQVSPQRRELMVSLSQPIFDADGGAAGVIGVDLYLQRLAGMLRTQRISSHGAAFVVDENGLLVAGSAGDDLFSSSGDGFVRRKPADSANPVIRAAYTQLETLWAQRRSDSVAVDTSLQHVPLPQDVLLMVQRPFGQALGLRWTLVVAAPESDFTGEIRRASRNALLGIIFLILLGTVIAAAVAHRLGQRLRRLSLAAGQLGRGEVPAIDQETRIREVSELSNVLHESAERLQSYRTQVQANAVALQQVNDTLESKVQDRTAQLAASREEALTAARAKSAFLATMSHEIRTPLNGVVGMSTLLAETSLDAEQRDYLETVRLSSDQLLAVINDILDFSKIESGKLELEMETLSLRAVVEEACDIAAPRAREKGLELVIDVVEQGPGAVPVAVVGDVTRLRQVLINLINNAVKFTAAGGEVAIHVRQLLDADIGSLCGLEFRISDNGIGIPPERIGSLFEAFTQVDTSTTRKYGGTGLGLAICKRLVALMGGQIGVESESGRGSTFWFTVTAPFAQLAPTLDLAGSDRLHGVRVLVVDDHATNVRILSRQLQRWGMDVVSADSGARALQVMQAGPGLPQVVITDMHMPEMDGLALARVLKASPAWEPIPLLLLSSGFMPAGDEGASLFSARLLKPARQNQLFETLLRCLSADPARDARTPGLSAELKKNVRVLVADDNAVNLKVACAILLKLGYDIATATDGREAVEAVAHAGMNAEPLGAVLMDVNMPDVDGLQATRLIKAAWGDASPPIIALTAAASADDRARCVAAGMDDYLTKPLMVAALARMLERWIPNVPALEVAVPATPADLAKATLDDISAGLMDFARLQEFRDYDDDALSMTREVITLFQTDAPRRIDAIASAIATLDPVALAQAAHALKGSAGNVGALAMQTAAAELEAAAQQELPGDASVRLARLRQDWERTAALLASWI
jgi:signal transduction histidine kinase/DNA-binding response OmpR family regulator/HPt (histidine-containing phosphotransfer) domain-containing protein